MPTPQPRVEAIHIAPEAGAPMQEQSETRAVAGRGLEGDRYYDAAGSWSGDRGRPLPAADRAVTFFEAETLDILARDHDITLTPADHRRNITTRNIALDHLVGHRIRVGDAVCEGVDLCEPCAYLESLTTDGVLNALIHRGGLNARILDTGRIAVNDQITRL